MWIIWALASNLLLSVVNWLDQYLTRHNPSNKATNTNVHRRVGGLILISTIMSLAAAGVLAIVTESINVSPRTIILGAIGAVGFAGMFVGYFYMLQYYAVHLVIPLFQLSVLWLLIAETMQGKTMSVLGLVGISFVIVGSYALDSGSLRWKIPSKLLLRMIVITLVFAVGLFAIGLATEQASVTSVSFWQFLWTGVIGMLLFVLVKNYRDGFLDRMTRQAKTFVGISMISEGLSLVAYFFVTLAISLAPLVTYTNAISGVQSIFVLLVFFLFPQKEVEKITTFQIVATIAIVVGVFLIERA